MTKLVQAPRNGCAWRGTSPWKGTASLEERRKLHEVF